MLSISLYQIACNWKKAFATARAMPFVCVAVSSCWNPKVWSPKRSVCKRKWHTSRSPMVETFRGGGHQGAEDMSRTRSKTAHGPFRWGKRYAEPLKTIGKTWRKPRKPGNKLRERKRLKTLSGLFIRIGARYRRIRASQRETLAAALWVQDREVARTRTRGKRGFHRPYIMVFD